MPVVVSYEPNQTPMLAVVTFRVTSHGLEAPDLALPTGKWQVDWELDVPNSTISSFGGVILPSSSDLQSLNVLLVDQPTQLSSSRWTATLKNERTATEGLVGFNYTIVLPEQSPISPRMELRIEKDPTIVVTTDPIGPPTF